MTTYLENCGWKCTPDAHFGTANEIHIWRIPVRPVRDSEIKLLSSEENKRFFMLKNNQSKNIFLCSRIAMKKLFASYLALPVDAIVFATHAQGKPYLKLENSTLEFNLTHSAEQVLLAVSNNGEIGIDIEAVRQIQNWESIARKVFDQITLESLLGSDDPENQFIRYWTTFESRQKLIGEGVFGSQPRETDFIKTFQFAPDSGYSAAISFHAASALPDLRFLEYATS